VADTRRSFWYWFWPPPPIARRLWLVIAVSGVYTAIVYLVQTRYIEEPAPIWLNEFAAVNAIVMGVLVGFRTKTAYDRWWEGRHLWGQLTNNSRNLCLKAVAVAGPPEADRRELLRLVAGFPVALMQHLRGPRTLQEVPGFEKEADRPDHVPAYLAGRVLGLIAGWRRAGLIDGHAQQVIDPHAAALMDVCGACEKIRTTPLPDSYLSLVRHGLILGLLLFPWQLTTTLGLWGILVEGVVIYFLVGVELIAEEVEQPFGLDGDDLPLEQFCETIRKNAGEILKV